LSDPLHFPILRHADSEIVEHQNYKPAQGADKGAQGKGAQGAMEAMGAGYSSSRWMFSSVDPWSRTDQDLQLQEI